MSRTDGKREFEFLDRLLEKPSGLRKLTVELAVSLGHGALHSFGEAFVRGGDHLRDFVQEAA